MRRISGRTQGQYLLPRLCASDFTEQLRCAVSKHAVQSPHHTHNHARSFLNINGYETAFSDLFRVTGRSIASWSKENNDDEICDDFGKCSNFVGLYGRRRNLCFEQGDKPWQFQLRKFAVHAGHKRHASALRSANRVAIHLPVRAACAQSRRSDNMTKQTIADHGIFRGRPFAFGMPARADNRLQGNTSKPSATPIHTSKFITCQRISNDSHGHSPVRPRHDCVSRQLLGHAGPVGTASARRSATDIAYHSGHARC